MTNHKLIDDFLPIYDVCKSYHILIEASAEQVYSTLRSVNFNEGKLTKWLLRLRGFPVAASFTLQDFQNLRFTFLGEKPNQELLFGLVGQFWKPAGNLCELDREGFQTFQQPGFAKAVWNFSLAPQLENSVLLSTETRVLCLDHSSRRWFLMYWSFIGFFSGIIRKEMLHAIKHQAEKRN